MCDKHSFVFDLARAYTEQAIQQFESSPAHRLRDCQAPAEYGVYALYLAPDKHAPVYVGKATNITLVRRLTEHARKIGKSRGVKVEEVWCRYLVINKLDARWLAVSCEDALITHYKPKWQNSGFGRHTPGKGRPGIRESVWDQWYPPEKS